MQIGVSNKMRQTVPRSRSKDNLASLFIFTIILVYVHVTLQLLFVITDEGGNRGEEVSPGLVLARSNFDNEHEIIQTTFPSEQHSGNVVDITAHDNRNYVNNPPPKFHPPPGYWEHTHQEFKSSTSQNLTLTRKKQLEQRRNKALHSFLPKRLITVVGPESSGTTFLSTTLAAAAGLGAKKNVQGRARALDGSIEIQHLSLPWGWRCAANKFDDLDPSINIVEALVPEECFRYELAPSLDHSIAEQIFMRRGDGQEIDTIKVASEGPQTETEVLALQQCRNKVYISEESNYCGAKCGEGVFNGYALYPRRFSVNITSHIEWYLQRGVDVTVIMSVRDRSISERGKENLHCKVKNVRRREDEVALDLMTEGLEKYGLFGSIERNRVIVSSYEVLMSLKNEYLLYLYKQLRINSTYVPSYFDGNMKYVTDANMSNMGKNGIKSDTSSRLSKSKVKNGANRNDVMLPKKLVSVVGLEEHGVNFLSDALEEAVSATDDFRVQQILLPQFQKCVSSDSKVDVTTIDVFVPEGCICYDKKLKHLDSLNIKECQEDERCGKDQLSGRVFHPGKFYVNVTSHIQWYMARGVDVKVILLLRDKTISIKERMRRRHCYTSFESAHIEHDTAVEIMREALQNYWGERVVVVVSYEILMQLKQTYLSGIYKMLGIESTYQPDFVDENRLFVAPDHQHEKHGKADRLYPHKKGHLRI